MNTRVILDVDQQMWEAVNRRASTEGMASTQISYFQTWECVQAHRWLILSIFSVTITMLFIIAYMEKRASSKVTSSIHKAKSYMTSSYFDRSTFQLILIVWTVMINTNTIFSFMREFAEHCTKVSTNQAAEPLSVNKLIIYTYFLSESFWFWVIEVIGVIGLLTVHVKIPHRLEFAVITCFIALCPTFYQSLTMTETDLNRIAVWCTHITFLMSLTILITFLIPWIKREYNNALYNIRHHTTKTLLTQRPEFDDLA